MSFYRYWINIDKWPYRAAACLFNKVDPDEEIPADKVDAVDDIFRLLKLELWGRYFKPGGKDSVPRETIMQWASDKEIDIPDELAQEWIYHTVEHELLDSKIAQFLRESEDIGDADNSNRAKNFNDYWVKADMWPLPIAACLLNGLDPDKYGDRFGDMPKDEVKKINWIYRMFVFCTWEQYDNRPQGDAAPRDTIFKFAIDKGLPIPDDLREKYIAIRRKEKKHCERDAMVQALKDYSLWNMSLNHDPEAEGRYTLEAADKLLTKETEQREGVLLPLLKEAVRDGSIPAYQPGINIPIKPDVVHEFYEEVYWNDLNKWIDETPAIRIDWQFPEPSPKPEKPKESVAERNQRIEDQALQIAVRLEQENKPVRKNTISYEIFSSEKFPDTDIGTIKRNFTLKDVKKLMKACRPPKKN